jgi:hypothetical protein
VVAATIAAMSPAWRLRLCTIWAMSIVSYVAAGKVTGSLLDNSAS